MVAIAQPIAEPEVDWDREFERCGNCGFTHFMHIIIPDTGCFDAARFWKVGDLCPAGIGMRTPGTWFRPAEKRDFVRWG